MGIYVTAKYAVVGMAESLRHDLKDLNIGVSAYIAGATFTELGRSTMETRPKGMKSGYAPPDPEMMKMYSSPGVQRPDWMMDPTEVGEIVLHGIRRNDLFIWPTAHYRDGIRYRMEALLRGMPDNVVDAETRKRTSRFNDIEIYLEQKQVPPWEDWDKRKK
jgi:short-subunit dehydrogenase